MLTTCPAPCSPVRAVWPRLLQPLCPMETVLALPDRADRVVFRGLWVVPWQTPIRVTFQADGTVQASSMIAGFWRLVPNRQCHSILVCFSPTAEVGCEPREDEHDYYPLLLRHVGGGAWRCNRQKCTVFVQTNRDEEAMAGPLTLAWLWSKIRFLLTWMHPTRDVHFVWLRTDGKVEFSTSIYERGLPHGFHEEKPADAGWSIDNIMEIQVQVNCKADNRKLRKLVLTKLDGAVFKVTGVQQCHTHCPDDVWNILAVLHEPPRQELEWVVLQ